MAYENNVDICFSLQDINACDSNVTGAINETVSIRSSMENSYDSANQFILSVLKWVDGCLEQNAIDAQNCRNFSQMLESLRWEVEKELERRQVQCDQLYKIKNEAYDHYEKVSAKQKPDNPSSEKAAERAWEAYRDAEKAFNKAYEEKEKCQRRLDEICLIQHDLYDVQIKIHDDEMRLTKIQDDYKMLSRDLDSARDKFIAKTGKAVSKLDNVLDDVKETKKRADKVIQCIGNFNETVVPSSTRVQFNSIQGVHRTAERIDGQNAEFSRAEREMKRTVDQYSEDLKDNIMRNSETMLGGVAKRMSKLLKENERKVVVMKELAMSLQNYYDMYR